MRQNGPGDDPYRRQLRVEPPNGNRSPVTLVFSLGRKLEWPIKGKPDGWSCVRSARTCTATNRKNPPPLPIEFELPTSGSRADRSFSVSAQAGLKHDRVSDAVPAYTFDPESLLRIQLSGWHWWTYPVRFDAAPPTRHDGPTRLTVRYGENLIWHFKPRLPGWSCQWSSRQNTISCTTPDAASAGDVRGWFWVLHHGHCTRPWDKRCARDGRWLEATVSAGNWSDTDRISDITRR